MIRRIFSSVARRLSPDKGAGEGRSSGTRNKPPKTEKSNRTLTTAERKARSANYRHQKPLQQIPFTKFEELAKRHGSPLTIKIYEHRKKYWHLIKPLELQDGAGLKAIKPIIAKVNKLEEELTSGLAINRQLHLAAEQIETLICRTVDAALMAEHGVQSLDYEFPAKEWNPKFMDVQSNLWHTMPPELQQIVLERLEKEIRT